jgi:N-acetylglucosamine-6-sulfatase
MVPVAQDPTSQTARLPARFRTGLVGLASAARDRYGWWSQRRHRGRPASSASRSRWVRLSLVAALVAIGLALPPAGAEVMQPQASSRPNIILILTDDLDANSIDRMPQLQRYLIDEGLTFENAFVTDPLCCPSRATILRGQYAHNHGVLTNGPPLGGFRRFESRGNEKSTIATWLNDEGYRTVLIGKYLNGMPSGYKPPGWDETYTGGFQAEHEYHTDWFSDQADAFIRRADRGGAPFFMYLATKAPHAPATPARRHRNEFRGLEAPRPPSFNEEDVSDKPKYVRDKAPFSARKIEQIDDLYRKRLRSMLAVDEMISLLVRRLDATGQLNNTYIFFTSDNGFSLGEHRRPWAKGVAYEEVIRVPLIVRGPGVPAGDVRDHMVLNNDFAPTFAQLGRTSAPAFVDGRSLNPLLDRDTPDPANWRSAFLVEGHAGGRSHHPTYSAVRTSDHLWVEYVNGERELYDLHEDPYQLESMHESADPALQENLKGRLAALERCSQQACRNAESGS